MVGSLTHKADNYISPETSSSLDGRTLHLLANKLATGPAAVVVCVRVRAKIARDDARNNFLTFACVCVLGQLVCERANRKFHPWSSTRLLAAKLTSTFPSDTVAPGLLELINEHEQWCPRRARAKLAGFNSDKTNATGSCTSSWPSMMPNRFATTCMVAICPASIRRRNNS